MNLNLKTPQSTHKRKRKKKGQEAGLEQGNVT